MNLFLLRHGEAESTASSDFKRSLTASGREDIINVATQFADKKPLIEKCLVSPYLRTQQTASLFVPLINPEISWETSELLVPEVGARTVINKLESIASNNILLISHNPLLSELYALLTEGDIHNIKIVSTSELLLLQMELPGLGLAKSAYSLCPETHTA